MSSGQAPMLMLDLATAHMRDRRRAARGLVSRASIRRPWAVEAAAARTPLTAAGPAR